MSLRNVFLLIVCCFLHSSYLISSSTSFEVAEKESDKDNPSCPNAIYSGNGQLLSPGWPNAYGNNENCVYFITAAPGFVIQIHFWSFDTELCCDYLDLFDGPDFSTSPKIARLSGAAVSPATYASSSRWLTMEFTTDPVITRPGFNASYYTTSTAYPCNRDVFISMDALSTLGTEENFQKELQFVANVLLANWTIGHNLTQVVPALMQSDDMISYGFNEIHSLADLQHDVLAYGSKSIKGQRPDALEAVFYLITPRITNQKAYKSGARVGIDRILVLFLSFMPNDNSDLTGSIRYANEIKAEGTTIAIVGMGPNMNVTALSALASGPQYLFTAASYDDLDTNLANGMKQVICAAN